MCCCSEDMLGGLGAFLLIVMFHSKMYKVLEHVLICTYEQTKVQPFFLSNRLQCHQTLYSI